MDEVPSHEASVVDRDAEAEASHSGRVSALGNLMDNETSPGVGTRVRDAQRFDVVAAPASPRDHTKVETVVNAEVHEWREVLLGDCVPQSQLGGDPVVKPVQNRQGVAAFWRRREPE